MKCNLIFVEYRLNKREIARRQKKRVREFARSSVRKNTKETGLRIQKSTLGAKEYKRNFASNALLFLACEGIQKTSLLREENICLSCAKCSLRAKEYKSLAKKLVTATSCAKEYKKPFTRKSMVKNRKPSDLIVRGKISP